MLIVNRGKCRMCGECIAACPFGAIEIKNGKPEITEACRMCGICIKKCSYNAIGETGDTRRNTNLEQWRGIMVFVEYQESISQVHPVTRELIGKGKELAAKINHPVYCVFAGHNIHGKALELTEYGIDRIFVYEHENYRYYREDIYVNALEDAILKLKPSIVLVGATPIGRSLAPGLATRFRTGLTADCTSLEVNERGELIQIRPAFGGNIMAKIVTPHTRPQFATVRYKVMDRATKVCEPDGERITRQILDEDKRKSKIEIVKAQGGIMEPSISDAQVIVAGGRGLKDKKDLLMLESLARLMGGQVAVTRPLVEAGWADYTRQIGLSGRTVKPLLIITWGISGAVQFTASMNTSQYIIAINRDRDAPIFKIAHHCIIGDLYEILPRLIEKISQRGDLRP